jgi:hypothetical protein
MRTKLLAGLGLLVVLAAWAVAEEKPWFDMEHCEMCKNFAQYPEMMENMSWEQHKISSGFMSVSTVPLEQVDAYRQANAQCNALGEKLEAGHQVPLCGSCDAFGVLLMNGAKMEQVELKYGGVMLLTSGDSTVVAGLHAWVDRNTDEMQKMMQSKAGKEE